MPQEQIQDVDISDIEVIGLLRKSPVDQEKLANLVQAIEEVGLLYPVRLTREGEKFAPADGYHRILAYLKLGRKTIPAIIEEKPLTEAAMIQKGLIANAHRIDNTPLEKAEGIARLMEITGWNASMVAEKLGLSASTVSRLLALLQLPEPIQEQVQRGEIPLSSATKLARVEDGVTQSTLASQVASGRLTRDALAGSLKAESKNGNGKAGTVTAKNIVIVLTNGIVVQFKADGITLDLALESISDIKKELDGAKRDGHDARTLAPVMKKRLKEFMRDKAKAGG